MKSKLEDKIEQMKKLYLGDAFEVIKTIPSQSVHLILTDPPYIISRDTNFFKRWR